VQEKSYEEQFQWLKERTDPNSTLESRFLETLFTSRRRLPDRTQFRPESEVYVEADFFYERDGLKGTAVFIDGPHHDDATQRANDERERRKLEDRGYRVVVIRYDASLEEQVKAHGDVFGPGLGA